VIGFFGQSSLAASLDPALEELFSEVLLPLAQPVTVIANKIRIDVHIKNFDFNVVPLLLLVCVAFFDFSLAGNSNKWKLQGIPRIKEAALKRSAVQKRWNSFLSTAASIDENSSPVTVPAPNLVQGERSENGCVS
jgi:hypothetical protein